MVEADPVLLNDLNSGEVGSSNDENVLSKAISEVSDTKLKKEFQNRLKNADNSRKIELVNRYGLILISSRIVKSVRNSNPKKKKTNLGRFIYK